MGASSGFTDIVVDGIIKVDGAVVIELLITTDKKLFYVAVNPTLANDELKMLALSPTNNVEVEAGKVAYSTAIMTVLASEVLIHWLTLLTLSLTDGTTTKNELFCSFERPFGMIESLTETKTVVPLLLKAVWVIVTSFKLASFKTQSAPL